MKKKPKLLLVSLDAVSSRDTELLAQQPAFKSLMDQGTLIKNVSSIFISNTYPIHTSMITGVLPAFHGIIDNTHLEFGNPEPYWRWYYDLIQKENIVSQALKQQLKIASVFWPVMAKAPIKYNIPEIIARDHENQIIAVLKNSTKLFALISFLKYGKEVQGSKQPQLDDFSTKVACSLLRKNNVDLLLLHLTDVDTYKHSHGIASPEVEAALLRMDKRLSKLLAAANDNYQILVVSDHAQVDVKHHIDLNQNNPFPATWWHLSEGTAVLLEKVPLDDSAFSQLKNWLEKQAFFRRYITTEEMHNSGFSQESRLAIAANEDWAFSLASNNHIGNHGYPTDLANYQAFYLASSSLVKAKQIVAGGSVLDVCPLSLRLLGLPAFCNNGFIHPQLIKDPGQE